MTRSYSAPTFSGTNQRSPTLIVSSGSSRSASTAGAITSMLSSVTGRIAICIGRARPSSLPPAARRRATPAAAFSKLSACPRIRLCTSGGPSIEIAIESMPLSTSSRASGSSRPPLVMTVQVRPRALTSRTSGTMSG